MSSDDDLTRACQGEPVATAASLPPAEAGGPSGLFTRILVPVDGGEAAGRALDAAMRLALRDGAELALIAVVDTGLAYSAEAGIAPPVVLADLRREARALLLRASLELPAPLHPDELVLEGRPGRAILDGARKWRADLIVLGRARRRGLGWPLANTTADWVARRAPCPVLTVCAAAPAVTDAGWRRVLRGAWSKEVGSTGPVSA